MARRCGMRGCRHMRVMAELWWVRLVAEHIAELGIAHAAVPILIHLCQDAVHCLVNLLPKVWQRGHQVGPADEACVVYIKVPERTPQSLIPLQAPQVQRGSQKLNIVHTLLAQMVRALEQQLCMLVRHMHTPLLQSLAQLLHGNHAILVRVHVAEQRQQPHHLLLRQIGCHYAPRLTLKCIHGRKLLQPCNDCIRNRLQGSSPRRRSLQGGSDRASVAGLAVCGVQGALGLVRLF
mmetsp:Transcript_21149/g.58743  ORF Transcript_21149/g.58743 Transcript_21149/m.58743 type:complete len:235 (-) Transcript_21149:2086-2790(-)